MSASSLSATSAPGTVAPSNGAAATTPLPSHQQQQAALNHLVAKYAYDQTHQTDTAALAALGRQIAAAARVLGRHVTLPRAPAADVQAQPSAEAPVAGRLNVSA